MSDFLFSARCLSLAILFTLVLHVLASPVSSSSTSTNLTKPPLDADHARAIFASRTQAIAERIKQQDLQRRASNLSASTGPAQNVSQSAIDNALAILVAAQAETNARNKLIVNSPRRNKGTSRTNATLTRRDDLVATPPNATVATAAALIAEAQAAEKATNGTLHKDYSKITSVFKNRNDVTKKRDTAAASFWMEDVEHLGTMPFGDDADYVVWRNVKDYGALGDGLTDDTAAINKAISDGNRCGSDCLSSTTKGAVVYFPPGTYLVSSSIISMYNTQLVGNANDWPIIYAASYFIGLGVISSDVYIDGGNGAEWYIEQSNFLRQIRNFVIDISDTTTQYPAALHWQVAQATSVEYVDFIMSEDAATTQQGIYAENGSGGWMSELSFFGGAYGLYGGEQQFTSRALEFYYCRTAIKIIWDWGWTWSWISINYANIGISLEGEGGARNTGSLHLIDSQIYNSNIGIQTFPPAAGLSQGTAQITVENVIFGSTPVGVQDSNGVLILAGGSTTVDYWLLGNYYTPSNPSTPGFTTGSLADKPQSNSKLSGAAGYFYTGKPQYESLTYANFVNMKDFAFGDGVTDDTATINLILKTFSSTNYVIYFPAGSYIVTDTILVPAGTRIVGECWAQIVGSGLKFESFSEPYVMVQVGNAGDTGIVEIQDMLFTAQGATAGIVLVEWNIRETTQGSAAMWDSHFRIGGASGTGLQVADCPILSDTIGINCFAGAMHLHITSSGSAYLENVWVWTADHDIDDAANTQVDIYVSRGILIESQGPTWLYGTASEHNIFYQYNLYNAKDVFMGMIQTESPYWSSGPYTVIIEEIVEDITFGGDPSMWDCPPTVTQDVYVCNAAWGLRIVNSTDVMVAGAGMYSWFKNYDESCVGTNDCQQRMVETISSGNVWITNLVTIGAIQMVVPHDQIQPSLASDNLNSLGYPNWSAIAAWTVLAPDYVSDGEEIVDTTATLYQFAGCKTSENIALPSDAVQQIKDGFTDAHTIATTAGVASGINWNSAAAVEFLGPPGLNQNQQSTIQANLQAASTFTPNSRLYDWLHSSYVQVRCDDIAEQCPCGTGKTLAYTVNNYGKDGYPMVNFCPNYFDKPRLAAAMTNAAFSPTDLNEYDNKGRVWLHEMMHMDPVAKDPHIADYKVAYTSIRGRRTADAYGPFFTKLLARYWAQPGLYISKNADNYAWYALAIYAQNTIGYYPHLPFVSGEPITEPTPNTSGNFIANDFNGTLTGTEIADDIGLASCPAGIDTAYPTADTVLDLTTLLADDQYPADYMTQLRAWQATA